MKLAATVICVDSVPAVLEFYRRAFGLEPTLVDLDVQLPGRTADGVHQFASRARSSERRSGATAREFAP